MFLDLFPYLRLWNPPFVVQDYFCVHVCVISVVVLRTVFTLCLGWSAFAPCVLAITIFGAGIKLIFPLEVSALLPTHLVSRDTERVGKRERG